jgi:F0F1-type ATP synthase assembly protein I
MLSPGLDLQPIHREREPATFPGDDRHRVDRQYLRFAGVGVQYALTILLLTLAGIWLDDKLGTAPLFLIVLLLLAFVGATWSLVHTVLGPPDKKGPKP